MKHPKTLMPYEDAWIISLSCGVPIDKVLTIVALAEKHLLEPTVPRVGPDPLVPERTGLTRKERKARAGAVLLVDTPNQKRSE